MRLVLKVLMSPDGCGLEGQTQTFEESGGSFGRGPANQWILPDPSRHISSVHGKIVYEAGQFSLVDESTNGIYLNDDEFPVGQGNKMALTSGDQLGFGEYVLQVEIEKNPDLSADTLVPGFGTPAPASTTPTPPADSFDDLDRWLDPVAPSAPAASPYGSASGSSRTAGKIDDGLMGGAGDMSELSDPLAALDGAGGKASGFTPTKKSDADFSLDDLLGSSAPPQHSTSAPAAQERMSLSKIPEPPAANLDPLASLDPLKSFDKTMVRAETAAEPKAVTPAFTPPANNAPPIKDESALADELDSFLSGAQPKSAPVPKPSKPAAKIEIKQAPAPLEAIKNAPTAPLIDELDADLDDFLKPVKEKAPSAAKAIPVHAPATTSAAKTAPTAAPAAETANKKTDSETCGVASTSTAPPTREPSKATTVASEDINRTLANLLGLEEVPPSALALLSETSADVLRESVKGLMLNLRARNQVKSEFRLNMTMIQAAENNPLKFSVTPDDALENMFAKTGKAYMRPVEAIKDGFADIGDHQIALFDAMRTAYDHMLNMFDPAQIEAKNPVAKSKGFLSSRKDTQWDQYKSFYQQLTADREQTFKRSFGEVFAESYERRMQELKVARIKAGSV